MARILLVEDDAELRSTIAEALESDGHEVLLARDGLEGFQALETRHPPQLVVLDLMLPLLSGWEFLRELRGDPRLAALKVVVTSAIDGQEMALAVDAVIRKPFERERLLGTVRDLL
jgi:CheY-like chemotaxis protein